MEMTPTLILAAILITFICAILFLGNCFIKKLQFPEIDWNEKSEIPTQIRIERNISKDVVILDLEAKKLHIGYYSYANDIWVISNENKSVEQPESFVWAYLN